MLTHANLTAATSQYHRDDEGRAAGAGAGRRAHAAGAAAVSHLLAHGVHAALHAARRRDDLARAVRSRSRREDLAAKRITLFMGVPTMFTALLAYPGLAELDLDVDEVRRLRRRAAAARGAATLPVAVSGCELNEGWGMTETSPSGTFTPMHGMRKAGSCGMPVPGVMLQVRQRDRSGDVRPARRARRDLHQGPERDEGLLEQPAGDRRRDDGRRLLAHRATSRTWTTTVSSSSSTASRTCCCAAATTCTRATSKRRSTRIPTSPRSA